MEETPDGIDFLPAMAAASRARVEAARAVLDETELRARALDSAVPPRLQLSSRRFDLIAEGSESSVLARVAGYVEAGAAAVSVLTEPSRFDGSIRHLELAVRALAGRIPAMRKDFLVDPYQILETRLAGAGGVLLILRMLNDADIGAMLECALQLKLFVLLEAFDEADIARASALVSQYRAAGQLLVGLNCRDLRTLKIVPGRLEQLARTLPDSVPRVAESGVATAVDAGRISVAGYEVALVGTALMEALEPLQLVRAMLSAGRNERARRS